MDAFKKTYKEIELDLQDEKLFIYLNSVKTHNALSTIMIQELTTILCVADLEPRIRVIILGGRGKSFCAGGDVKAMKNKTGMFAGDSNDLRKQYTNGIQMIPKTIEALETPIIAMMDGAAVGAGMDLSMMCDFRVCTTNTIFKGSFAKLGLVPGDGGTYFLTRAVGYAKALEIYLLGEVINSDDAQRFGMITKLTDREKLVETTIKLANKLILNGSVAIGLTKKALKNAQRETLDVQLDRLSTYQGIAQRTDDHFEGVNALLEKRDPSF